MEIFSWTIYIILCGSPGHLVPSALGALAIVMMYPILDIMTIFLAVDRRGGLPLPSPRFAIRALSFTPPYGQVTNRSHHEKVGTVDFDSPAQVGSESTLQLESSVGSPPRFTQLNE